MRLTQLLSDSVEGELRRAEAALRAAAATLDPGRSARPPALPDMALLDRAVRGTAAALGLPVTGLDAMLAPLVESERPPGTALPASPTAVLAADALATLQPVVGLLDPAEAGIGVAVPVTRQQDGRPIAVLVARLPPALLGERLAALLAAETGAERIVSARLVMARGPEAPVETLAWIRAGAIGTAQLRLPEGPTGVVPALPDAAPAQPDAAPRLLMVTRRLARLHRCAVVLATLEPVAAPAPVPSAQPDDPPAAPQHGLLAAVGLGAAGVGGLLAGVIAARTARRNLRTPDGRSALVVAASEQEARQSLTELRAICDTIPVGLALLDARGRLLSANLRLAAFAGLPAEGLPGRFAGDVLPPPLAEAIEAGMTQVLREGRPVLETPLSVEAPGTLRHSRHLLVSCHPVRDQQGRIESVSVTVQDVTERARAEAGRELLVRELNHRVKNCLATVQTIARQTLRFAGSDPAGFERSFGERLRILARAHDLLTEHSWGETELRLVVHAALAPWLGDARLALEPGPEVMLRPSQAQALMLALHELATNAAKYGALTRDEGHVALAWSLGGDGMVELRWQESGGPPVPEPPVRRGFGTRLLEQALRQDLGSGSKPEIVFDPEGLRVSIRFRPGRVLPPRIAA